MTDILDLPDIALAYQIGRQRRRTDPETPEEILALSTAAYLFRLQRPNGGPFVSVAAENDLIAWAIVINSLDRTVRKEL